MIVKNIVIRDIDGGIKIDLKDADMNNTELEDKVSFIFDNCLEELVNDDLFDKLLKKVKVCKKKELIIWNTKYMTLWQSILTT